MITPGPNADAGQDAGLIDRLIEEPITEEDYYLRNGRSDELHVVAFGLFGDSVELLEDTVAPHSEVRIYHAWEGTGGHAMPSNFFGSFQVLVGDQVIYEGVRNDDWQAESLGLYLTIASEGSAEPSDYACEQATDCEIKNVGNCCGYFPRCVNADSPTPPVQCADGLLGVCGWPTITHCECVENTCHSMQGDSEV